MNPAHSKGKPGVSLLKTNINIRFAKPFTINLPIQNPMKNSATAEKTSNGTTRIHPALFQVVARTDVFAPIHKDAPSPLSTPFADWMLDKGKLEAVLKTIEKKKPGSGTKSTSTRNTNRRKPSEALSDEVRQSKFNLQAPAAHSVKLAADFTDWEKSSLDMVKSENGIWFTIVPLSPGNYAYRFIVDGRCNDPRSAQRVPNPFGTFNAVMKVT
jgi:hypothetical protein